VNQGYAQPRDFRVFLHRILTMSRRKKPRARTRRSAAPSRFQLESLEDRTALSTASAFPQFAPVVFPTVEVNLIAVRPETLLVLESAATASIGTGQANSPVPASSPADRDVIGSSAGSAEPTLITPAVIESMANGALSTGGVTAMAPLQGPDVSLTPRSSALPLTIDSSASFADPRATQLPFMTGSIATFRGDSIPLGGDVRFATPSFPMFAFPIPENLNGLDLLHSAMPANIDDKETDQSLSGSVDWTETDTGFLTWMSLTQASGRSSGRSSSPIFTDLALQVNFTGELASASGLSYLATAGSTTLLAELSALRADENVLLVDQDATELDTTATILDAGIPLNILLAGTDVPLPTEQGEVEQVAELIPLSESSLALAATLWTVRADSQVSAPGSDLPAGAATDPVVGFPSPTHWAVFMTGIDRAFEQSFRDVQVDTFVGDGRHGKSHESQRGVDDRLRWQGPILPGAAQGLQGGERRSARPGQSSAGDESNETGARNTGSPSFSHLSGDEHGEGTSQTIDVAQPQDSDDQPVVLASTPMLCVASISSIVVGWFWGKKRERRQRSWRERIGES
jgi:hypothetical protein